MPLGALKKVTNLTSAQLLGVKVNMRVGVISFWAQPEVEALKRFERGCSEAFWRFFKRLTYLKPVQNLFKAYLEPTLTTYSKPI